MRFALKCIVALAIVYRAILLSQSGSGTFALSSQVTVKVSSALTLLRNEIAGRAGVYCEDDPTACLANAEPLAALVSPAADATSEPRRSRHGAVAAAPY